MTVDIPPIISVDDHVVEPPDLWQRWLPSRHREAGPRVIRAPYEMTPRGRQQFSLATSGPETDFWAYEDRRIGVISSQACAGLGAGQMDLGPIAFDDIRPGCLDPKARVADMDVNHVDRSLCFPNILPRFCGQTFLEAKDRDLALACVTAYNDWMVDEWCGDSEGRLIPLCLIPLWDPHLAAQEVRRNAGRGAKAVTFSELPAHLGLPSLYDADRHWDPFFTACEDTGTVICMHIGSGSTRFKTADDAPAGTMVALIGYNCQFSLADWLLSGVLARFPKLKIAFSEGQIGWMPYLLERVDRTWTKARAFAEFDPAITSPPSSYMRGRVYGCFFEDDFGVWARDWIGLDIITFESDYPHQDGTWPDTEAYAQGVMKDLPAEIIYKFARGNAITMLDLGTDPLLDRRFLSRSVR